MPRREAEAMFVREQDYSVEELRALCLSAKDQGVQCQSLDEALLALQQVIALKPNNQSAYYHLAQLYKKLGNDEAVRSAYQKTIELGARTQLGDRARKYLEGWRPRIINASQQ